MRPREILTRKTWCETRGNTIRASFPKPQGHKMLWPCGGRAVKFSVFAGFIPYPGLPEPVGDSLPQIIPAA